MTAWQRKAVLLEGGGWVLSESGEMMTPADARSACGGDEGAAIVTGG